MAEPWIRVHANLAGKPVVIRAAEALHVSPHEAIGLLVQFWGAVSQHATNGSVGGASDTQLEVWAGWRKKRGLFAAFIRSAHLDPSGRVNEWDDYAGALEDRRTYDRDRKRTERERKRRDREAKSVGRRTENPPDSPQDVPVTSTPTIRDDTKRDERTTSSSSPREELLRSVPHRASWEAEMNAALQGMHGPLLTLEQLEHAIGDYLGNGASKEPNLRHFRAYLRDAARVPVAAMNGATSSDPTLAALEKWKQDTDARERRERTA